MCVVVFVCMKEPSGELGKIKTLLPIPPLVGGNIFFFIFFFLVSLKTEREDVHLAFKNNTVPGETFIFPSICTNFISKLSFFFFFL